MAAETYVVGPAGWATPFGFYAPGTTVTVDGTNPCMIPHPGCIPTNAAARTKATTAASLSAANSIATNTGRLSGAGVDSPHETSRSG